MIFNLGADGYQKDKKPPSFTTDAQYLYAEEVKSDGTYNWELAILTSGSITFHRVVPVDIFLVGGGAAGGIGYKPNPSDPNAYRGGSGGYGGGRVRRDAVTLSQNVPYAFVIGGSNGNTTGFGETAQSGAGSRGGGGGTATNGYKDGAAAGMDGTVAFHNHATETDLSLITSLVGRKYGPGGGGGQVRSGNYYTIATAQGGATGGGRGGNDPTTTAGRPGVAGQANCGAGGGGGCTDNGAYYDGGAGGSGIIIIRNAR